MKNLYSLEGKRVLVTGGTRGIGRAISLQFARAGASVVANYVRDVQAAESLLAEANQEGIQIRSCRADLASAKGVENLVGAVDAVFPRLSCLVHCAATGVHKPLEQLTLRHFDWTYGLNVRAFFDLVNRLLPKFEQGASILGISSEGAGRAVPHYALVGSTKGALESLIRHMAVELAPRGVRVNALAPGIVMTDVWKVLPDSKARLEGAVQRSPLKRLVSLEEVAQAAQFLCCDAASGIVGQTLVADGGTGIVA